MKPTLPVVIIGGGIAGLSAAWELHRQGEAWLLLEASDRLGGTITTVAEAGFVAEGGPDSFLTAKPAAADLCQELGLGNEMVGTLPNPAGIRLEHRGRLHTVPAGWRMIEPTRLGPVLRSPLFSAAAKARIAVRWWRPQLPPQPEESVAGYLRRRFGRVAGQTLADTVAGPLVGGVYGGDTKTLSAVAARPASLSAGSVGTARGGTVFASLRRGMGQLVEALQARLPAEPVRMRHRVTAIRADAAGGFRLEVAGEAEVAARGVMVAAPAWRAAELLRPAAPELAAELAAIPYASSVNVNMGYITEPTLPSGHGFLGGGGGGDRLLACTFAHQKFPERAPRGGALLRLFFGAAALEWDDRRIEQQAEQELRDRLGITAAPNWIRIQRCARAMPQYTVGHGARVAAIRAKLAQHPTLGLAGNAYDGVGVPDCIASGRAAARIFLA